MELKTTIEKEENLKSLSLDLKDSGKEGLRIGMRKDGKPYAVRDHRMRYLMPIEFIQLIKALPTRKSRLTAEVMIQTGARINELRHITEEDIDFIRNTLRLRFTKTKAIKGEKRGRPRTIPINSKFVKELKKNFEKKKIGEKIGILSTASFNTALKKALKEIGIKDYYMFSSHNLRKTHGNWLKVLASLRVMELDATEICLRMGHDYNTFLRDYGSSGVLDSKDVLVAREILGDLYSRDLVFRR